MPKFSEIPNRGDFNFQTLVAPYKVSGKKIENTSDQYGLKFTKHMPFGTLRDDEGHMYSLARALNSPGSTPNPTKFLFLSTRVDEQTLRIDSETMESRATTMFPKRWMEGDSVHWSSLDDEDGAPWNLSASGTRFTWHEAGLLELEGKLLGNGTQFYIPGEEWGTFYVSQLYDVSGVLNGRPVKGVICLDQVWLPEGGAIHYAKDIVVENKMHVLWWTFATVYKDGSWDMGSFMLGHENLGYAIFQNSEGRVHCTTDIEGEAIHKDGSYFLKTARIFIDGKETWEFLPDARGDMVDFVGGFPITAQQEGRWRKEGDTREPDHWIAWGESDRRNGSARNVRGSDL